ncbi:PilZ domain-containing protein [Sphingomonas sp.]|uniref:PilZ domain-containing protein n=1 Tax=Sphingomonas sp. TaxID=28214 RepID=UPI0037523F31
MTDKAESIERRAEREPFGAEIELRRTRGMKYHVTVRDCSPEGCCINLVDRVGLDEVIWVKLPGLESLEAYVCWTKGFVAGLEFAKPLHPAVFQMLLQRNGGA